MVKSRKTVTWTKDSSGAGISQTCTAEFENGIAEISEELFEHIMDDLGYTKVKEEVHNGSVTAGNNF